MNIDHPNILKLEKRFVFDESALKWKLHLVVHTDLSWEGLGVARAQEILEAAQAAFEQDPNGAWYPPTILGRMATPKEL